MNKASRYKINFTNIAIISVIAIFFILDRFLKNLALKLAVGESYNLIGDILSFSFAKNPYIAFSLPINPNIINILVVVIIASLTITIFFLIYKQKGFNLSIIILTLILLGAISNMLDRWQYAYVIDYLSIKNISVFNLADAMIFIGFISYIYSINLKKNFINEQN